MNEKLKIEFDRECTSCKGTGLYSGIGEGPTAGIVCTSCNGTGCAHIKIEYTPFLERRIHDKIKRVYATNPGIKIGENNDFKLEDFGGIPVEDWLAGKPFLLGSENRKYTCPAWWYQGADYEKKPNWKDGEVQCLGIGSFSSCQFFLCKEKCWARFDKEQESTP